MHDQSRRAITMLLFFVFGPLLTFGLVAGGVVRRLPSNARTFERTVALRTGLDIQIDSIEFRTPGSVRVFNLRLADERSPHPVFQAPVAELTFVPTAQLQTVFEGLTPESEENAPSLVSFVDFFSVAFIGRFRQTGYWRLSIPQSAIRLETLTADQSAAKTKRILFELLSRYRSVSKEPIQIVMDEIELQTQYTEKRPDKRPEQIRFLVSNLYRINEIVRSEWSLKLPSVSETETHHVSIIQRQTEQGNDVGIRLITGCPLPNQTVSCDLAAVFCSLFGLFGEGSRFSGEIAAMYRSTEGADPWTIRLTNFFLTNLDVSKFAADYTPFRVQGTVKGLQIDEATFSEKTFNAKGWMEVVSGTLERPLFHRLVDRFSLNVQPSSVLESPNPVVPFNRCAVWFQLEKEGAKFWTKSKQSLIMVRGAKDPYEMEVCISPRIGLISYHEILSAFAPDVAPVVPLTGGTRKILSVLPTEPPAPKSIAPVAPLTANPWDP